jgi:alpha/beta superfamily hydrolase
MHSKVLYRAAKGAVAGGVVALRFNFRGVGRSGGVHDEGKGEGEDVRAAIDELAGRYPDLPLVVGGYSFGATVGLRAAQDEPRVRAAVGIGLPVLLSRFEFLVGDRRPLLLVQGERDPFGPGAEIQALARRIGDHVHSTVIPGADHFFEGCEERVGKAVRRFCQELSPPGGEPGEERGPRR